MAQVWDAAGDQASDPAVEYAEQMLGEMPDTEARDQNLQTPGTNTTTNN